MKMSKYIILSLLVFALYVSNISACSEKIEKEAYNVNAYYKIHQIEDLHDTTPPVKILIENITQNIYVEIFETLDDSTKKYYFSDTNNGLLTIDFYYIYKSIDYTITVYAVDENCTEKLKELTVTTPKYNKFSDYKICEENKEYEYCKTFVDEDLSEEKVKEKIIKYNEYKDTGAIGLFINFIKEYYLFVLLPVALVSGFFIVKLGINKRRIKK